MDIAIVGAFGSVGRQLAMQILDERILDRSCTLQLVARHGGLSEREMFGMRSDLADAFADDAPSIEVCADAHDVSADIVVMLAGASVPRDLHAPPDRAALGAQNLGIFRSYADALAAQHRDVTVIVQSNPVELGVDVFARALGRQRVLGAGSWNDTLRFRRELASYFGVRRPDVAATMLGEHGGHMVPVWSRVRIRSLDPETVRAGIAAIRHDRPLRAFPDEIAHHRGEILGRVVDGDIAGAYAALERLPPDVRSAVKPFFIHFTSGRTTEVATAHAVVDIARAIMRGERTAVTAQVLLDGEFCGLDGVMGAAVVLDGSGWSEVIDTDLADDEAQSVHAAADAIRASIAAAERPAGAPPAAGPSAAG